MTILPPPAKPWKNYLPESFTCLFFPRNVHLFVRGKNCSILCSHLVLQIKSKVTFSSTHCCTAGLWKHVRIKAKLSMMDDIAYYITVMAGSKNWICRWLKWHRWFHPWSNLKQLWCNPFCIKEKKKKTLDMAHGSPSCWLWMLSLFKVWQLYLAFFFFFFLSGLGSSDFGICYSFFWFWPWTILTM